MKKLLLFILISVSIIACQSDKKTETGKAPNGQHMAIVEEVLQTTEYTYLRVKENDIESRKTRKDVQNSNSGGGWQKN